MCSWPKRFPENPGQPSRRASVIGYNEEAVGLADQASRSETHPAQNTQAEKTQRAGVGVELASKGTGRPSHGLNQTPFQHPGQLHEGRPGPEPGARSPGQDVTQRPRLPRGGCFNREPPISRRRIRAFTEA